MTYNNNHAGMAKMYEMEVMCERCGERRAVGQQCPGDYADHRHGRVHAKDTMLLVAVCLPCGEEVAAEWGTERDPATGRYLRRHAPRGAA